MPTSATCRTAVRSTDGPRAMRQRGFTLLEMIVVLAILGLATALVAPAALSGIDSWRRQAAMDLLLDQVRGLPGRARATGETIVVSKESLQSAAPPLRIAEGWTLRVEQAFQVAGNGVCQRGELVVAGAYGDRVVRVEAPFCDVAVVAP